MKISKFFLFILLSSFIFSCSNKDDDGNVKLAEAIIKNYNEYDSGKVGNIILNDGTFVEADKITEEQKSNAIAVVIYDKEKCLGVGLKQNKKDSNGKVLPWCLSTAKASKILITSKKCTVNGERGNYTFEDDTDGSDNLEQISAFLKQNNLEDDTQTLSNYPDFEFAKEYKEKVSNLGNYKDNWYLPSIKELFMIHKNRAKINKSLKILNADDFTDPWRDWFYSSSQSPKSKDKALALRISDSQISEGSKTTLTGGYVCAIRKF